MEFLLYLSPQSMEIYNIISKMVRVVENTPICYQSYIFGNYNAKTKFLAMCTNSIKDQYDRKKYVNETFLHEVVHVAQSCKSKNGTLVAFGINPYGMNLNAEQKQQMQSTLQYDYRLRYIDHEALWLSNKPEKVKQFVKRYCF